MANTVQIDHDLFRDLMLYHCVYTTDSDSDTEWRQTHENALRAALEAKLDKLVNRELYSRYKAADTAEEREAARKEYLDKIGVPSGCRY